MLLAAIRFFFSPVQHLTRFSGNELLPHCSNECARFYLGSLQCDLCSDSVRARRIARSQ
jgi:hypothetical protein